MNEDIAVRLQNISKKYRLYDSPQDRMKEALHPFRKKYHKDFYALKDINLEIKKGESLGIIGKNGAGKSTLLKIITGVLTPTTGNVTVNGKISALLELGAGFNPQYTGRENIYFKSSLMGYSRKDIDDMVEEIIESADIGAFIDQPIKTYSSGMFIKLAFSVSININPDILILDEIMSVGDIVFRQKAIRKMEEILEKSKCIIYVTHNIAQALTLCNKAVWLDKGVLIEQGFPKKVVEDYQKMFLPKSKSDVAIQNEVKKSNDGRDSKIEFDLPLGNPNVNSGDASIKGIALYRKKPFEKIAILNGGEDVCLLYHIEILCRLEQPIIGFTLKNIDGISVYGTNTYAEKYNLGSLNPGEFVFGFDFKFPLLRTGMYSLDIAIGKGTQEEHEQLNYFFDGFTVQVVSLNKYQFSLINPKIKEMYIINNNRQ